MIRAALALALALSGCVYVGTVPASASCGSSCYVNWNVQAFATCGACTTGGTEEFSVLPTTWSVPEDSMDYDLMNEASWLVYKYSSNSTETGYFSGWWPYSNPRYWNVGLLPYGAYGQGFNGIRGTTYLTGGDDVISYTKDNGQSSEVDVQYSWTCHNCWPAVATPRYNAAQGEIHAYYTDFYGTPWLNNGSPGEQFSMYYLSGCCSWYQWGNLNLQGASPPYWSTKQNSYQWSNGGY